MRLPVYEPVYLTLVKLTRPLAEPLSRKLVEMVVRSDPTLFEYDECFPTET